MSTTKIYTFLSQLLTQISGEFCLQIYIYRSVLVIKAFFTK